VVPGRDRPATRAWVRYHSVRGLALPPRPTPRGRVRGAPAALRGRQRRHHALQLLEALRAHPPTWPPRTGRRGPGHTLPGTPDPSRRLALAVGIRCRRARHRGIRSGQGDPGRGGAGWDDDASPGGGAEVLFAREKFEDARERGLVTGETAEHGVDAYYRAAEGVMREQSREHPETPWRLLPHGVEEIVASAEREGLDPRRARDGSGLGRPSPSTPREPPPDRPDATSLAGAPRAARTRSAATPRPTPGGSRGGGRGRRVRGTPPSTATHRRGVSGAPHPVAG
jgi:hypothetical protein